MPAEQGLHSSAPWSLVKVPRGQAEQSGPPAVPLKPGKHRHEDALGAPVAADDVRSGHAKQTERESPLMPSLYVLAGH